MKSRNARDAPPSPRVMRVFTIAALLALTTTAAADPLTLPARSADGATLALAGSVFDARGGATHVAFCARDKITDCETFLIEYCCELGDDPYFEAQRRAGRERYAKGRFVPIPVVVVHEEIDITTARQEMAVMTGGPIVKRSSETPR